MAVFKKSRHQFVVGATVAAVATAVMVLWLARTSGFRRLENITYDERAVLTAHPADADKRIVILDIDNASFNAFKETSLGRWPWPRSVWGQIVWYLSSSHTRAIAFDAVFGGQDTPENDKLFADQIRAAGDVVLSYNFSSSDEITGDDPAERARKLKLLEPDSVGVVPGIIATVPEGKAFSLNIPLDSLASAAAGLGNINTIIDRDGITRRVNIALRLGDRAYPSLSTRTADLAAKGSRERAFAPFVRSGRTAQHDGWEIPVDENGNLLVLWHGGTDGTYERIPIWQVICSIQPQGCDENKVYYQPEYFRDKVVLIGASFAGSYEVRPTPFDETAPGFMVHVTAIDNLLHHEAMRVAPRWFVPLAVIAAAILGAAMLVGIGSAGWSLGVLLLAELGYAGAAYWTFGHLHLWLPLVAPTVALVVSFASTGTIRYATTGRELRKTRGTLNRYMAPQLVDYVLNNVDNLEFAGEKRELTIFFSDVRNFTTLTEKSDPMVLIAMLNEYLEAMTSTIFKHDGIVDKFIGDGILAYWGAFTPGNHARQAAEASLEMFGRLKELNARWAEMGRPEIDIGVGLNTGEVILGNVGAGKKIEFTVIGDPVNLASRLESLNKEYKCHIIISEFTLARLGDAATVRSLGGVKVKGKTIETSIYELQGLREENAAAAKK
jgi:adenylate cyclase